MELSLITEKLRAIAFPLETCSSPINDKHIGGTNEKIMTWKIIMNKYTLIESASYLRQLSPTK